MCLFLEQKDLAAKFVTISCQNTVPLFTFGNWRLIVGDAGLRPFHELIYSRESVIQTSIIS